MTRSVQSTEYPKGYIKQPKTAEIAAFGYNSWQRNLQREVDKIYKTDKASKYFVR